MAGVHSLPALAVLTALLVVFRGGEGAQKKLTHPAFTGTAALTLKVLYWLVSPTCHVICEL